LNTLYENSMWFVVCKCCRIYELNMMYVAESMNWNLNMMYENSMQIYDESESISSI
jgi:hypothetical protein